MSFPTPRNLDNLSYAADLITGQVLWNFSKVNEFALPISRPSASFAVPGVHGKYDPMGYDPNFLDFANLKVKFYHQYVGNETYWGVKDNLWGAIGNQAVFLYIVESDGTIKRNIGKLTTRPNDETTEQTLAWCEFELDFELTSPFWKRPPGPGALFYDIGQRYDVGLAYDIGGQSVLLTGTQPASGWPIILTNAGNAPEYEARYVIAGPLGGAITVANLGIITPAGYMVMTWNPAIAPANPDLGTGETITIDPGLGLVTRNGVPDMGHFTWGLPGSGQREWMRIDKGTTTISISHTSGANGGIAFVFANDTWIV